MVKNKHRLYVAVYPDEDAPDDKESGLSSFRWALLVGTKVENKVVNPGRRYHVERLRSGTPEYTQGKLWRFAETIMPSVSVVARMYARILIAKIEDEDRLVHLLKATRAPPAIPGDPAQMALRASWDSRVWVGEVLAALEAADGIVGTSVLDWQVVERTATHFVAGKMATGRYESEIMQLPNPTWDMLLGKETAG